MPLIIPRSAVRSGPPPLPISSCVLRTSTPAATAWRSASDGEGAVVELHAVNPREDRDASRLFKPLSFGHDGLVDRCEDVDSEHPYQVRPWSGLACRTAAGPPTPAETPRVR